MNREIKFRAWDKVNGNMLFNVSTGTVTTWSHPDNRAAESKDCVFMQFTGLHDKNGKEIYEGDIVKDDVHGVGEVKFGGFMVEGEDYYSNYCSAGWYVKHKGNDDNTEDLDGDEHEVIGNIYKNPNLLK